LKTIQEMRSVTEMSSSGFAVDDEEIGVVTDTDRADVVVGF